MNKRLKTGFKLAAAAVWLYSSLRFMENLNTAEVARSYAVAQSAIHGESLENAIVSSDLAQENSYKFPENAYLAIALTGYMFFAHKILSGANEEKIERLQNRVKELERYSRR